MNNPNPFVPQGSLLEQKNKKRARFKVAVISIFAVNIVFVSGLLIQGCSDKKKDELPADTGPAITTDTNLPDTNFSSLPAVPGGSNATAVYSNTPPPPPPAPPAPPVPTTTEYVVARGDSFYSIAKKFHVKIKDIQSANPNVVPTKLKSGQKLQIPAGASGDMGTSGSTGSTGGAPMADTGDNAMVYVVKPGDSLMKIAKSHNSTIKLIRSANDLKTDKIKVGQKLKVPAKSAPADTGAATPMATPPPISAPIPSAPAPSAPAPGPGH